MITYEKGSAPTQKINLANSVKTDLRGLGTGVGGFSNLATTMYAMIEQFDEEKGAEQRAELRHRIKLLREIVGQEIDRIKGTAAPVVPQEWKHMEKIQPEDTDAEKAEKYKHNSMVITKKPYFFRYLYPELNKQLKQYESSYNQMCLSTFGVKLKQLLAKEEKTEAEKKVIRLYHKYSPLITSNCTMNILCREFEDADFEISFRKSNVSMLPTFEKDFTFDQAKYELVKKQYQKFGSTKQINLLNHFFEYDDNYLVSQKTNDFKTIKFKISDSICADIRQELASHEIKPAELLFYANELSHHYKKFNWAFVWEVLDTQILSFIPQGTTKAPINIKDIDPITLDGTEPTGEYLGQTYVLKDVTKQMVEFKKETEQDTEEIESEVLEIEQREDTKEISQEEEDAEYAEMAELIERFIEQSADKSSSTSPSPTTEENWEKYNDLNEGYTSSMGDAITDWWGQYLDKVGKQKNLEQDEHTNEDPNGSTRRKK